VSVAAVNIYIIYHVCVVPACHFEERDFNKRKLNYNAFISDKLSIQRYRRRPLRLTV